MVAAHQELQSKRSAYAKNSASARVTALGLQAQSLLPTKSDQNPATAETSADFSKIETVDVTLSTTLANKQPTLGISPRFQKDDTVQAKNGGHINYNAFKCKSTKQFRKELGSGPRPKTAAAPKRRLGHHSVRATSAARKVFLQPRPVQRELILTDPSEPARPPVNLRFTEQDSRETDAAAGPLLEDQAPSTLMTQGRRLQTADVLSRNYERLRKATGRGILSRHSKPRPGTQRLGQDSHATLRASQTAGTTEAGEDRQSNQPRNPATRLLNNEVLVKSIHSLASISDAGANQASVVRFADPPAEPSRPPVDKRGAFGLRSYRARYSTAKARTGLDKYKGQN